MRQRAWQLPARMQTGKARGGGGVGGDAELVEGVVAPRDDGELGVSGAEKRNGEKLLAVEGVAERAVV